MTDNSAVAVSLLKIALGVSHSARDGYFTTMINGIISELAGRGCDLDLTEDEDLMLVVDYAEFRYRNRDGDKAMPRNLELRVRNRIVKGRAADAGDTEER